MKKITAWALVLCMIFPLLAGNVSAAASLEGEVLPVLAVMGVMNGDEKGNLDLARGVTRAEFVKMAVSASPFKAQGKAVSAVSPYPDVKAGAWHSGYITVSRNMGYISGYLDGTFRPDNYVTLEEAVSVMLKVMGYSGTDFAAGYPTAHMTLYHSLGLDEGMTAVQGDRLTRRDCAILVYNCLNAKAKSGYTYANQLGYAVDANGKIDYASLALASAKGPVINNGGSLKTLVGFEPLTVYRDRSVSSPDKIGYNDVLYYIEEVKTVWAYSSKISGIVQAISPSTLSPSTVTVSGRTCPLGSSQAVYAFSDLGTVKVGDSVTLLLGAGGTCVYVLTGNESENIIYGVVSSVGTQTFADGFGNVQQSRYITVCSSDGNTYSYPYPTGSLKEGNVVKVTVSANGVSFSKVTKFEKLTGTVRNGRLDGAEITSDSKIIDYLSGKAVKVSAERLEGVTVASRDVLFCKVDANGDIEHLILGNATGDNRSYGIVLAAFESPDMMNIPSTYTVMVNGVPTVHSAYADYNVKVGPCAVEYGADGAIESLSSLRSSTVEAIHSYGMDLKNGEYIRNAAGLQVYIKDDDSYYISSLNNVSLEEYKLTAYFDGYTENGGMIRMVIAEEK